MILSAGSPQWMQLVCLTVALVLSTAIGAERQLKQKSAGMRTHTLVGLGAALFVIVSKYGFDDVLGQASVGLDPSRVAAQIVSGIGFIGAGLVFVRRGTVRGLTTASSVWLTAAVGTAAGAGLVVPAVFVTLAYFLVAALYPRIIRSTRLGHGRRHSLRLRYVDGRGALRRIAIACTHEGFAILGLSVSSGAKEGLIERIASGEGDTEPLPTSEVEVELEVEGMAPVGTLITRISGLDDVTAVAVEDESEQ